jgi:hypothetical protein
MSSAAGEPLPEDRNMGTVLIIVTSILLFFTITTTVLRLWARYMRANLGWVRLPLHSTSLLHADHTSIDKD